MGGFFSGVTGSITEAIKRPLKKTGDVITGTAKKTGDPATGAAAGGLAFGPLGAVAGGLIGGEKIKETAGELGDVVVKGAKKLLRLGDDDYSTDDDLSGTAKTFEEMAAQQWAMYKKYFAPYEIETIKAKSEFLPEFKRQTSEGIDVGKRMDEAGAEVMAATKLGEGRLRRGLSRFGIDPSSSTYGNLANISEIETAKGVAGARTAAKTAAEGEKYARLGSFLDKTTPDPYARAIQGYSGAAQSYTSLANLVANKPPSSLSKILGLAGGGLGAYFGGPAGAAVGYGIGSQLA
jgi:hypothetical protein